MVICCANNQEYTWVISVSVLVEEHFATCMYAFTMNAPFPIHVPPAHLLHYHQSMRHAY